MWSQAQVASSAGTVADFADQYPELYPNHLAIASCIRAWAERMTPDLMVNGRMPGSEPINEDDYILGYVRALRDMADLLVDGDGLPDGPLFALTQAAEQPIA